MHNILYSCLWEKTNSIPQKGETATEKTEESLPRGFEFALDGVAVHVAGKIADAADGPPGRPAYGSRPPRGLFHLSFSVASPAIAERIARIQNPMTILLSGMPSISK